jgi:hypothetical protein
MHTKPESMRNGALVMMFSQEWDIVMNCLNLGFSFTQMLPHAPIPWFQIPDSSPPTQCADSTNDKIFYLRVPSHRVFSWC